MSVKMSVATYFQRVCGMRKQMNRFRMVPGCASKGVIVWAAHTRSGYGLLRACICTGCGRQHRCARLSRPPSYSP